MRLSHPSAPFQGVPAEDVFFAANDQFIQMGVGFLIVNMQEDVWPQRPLQLYLDVQAQASARSILLGALLGRAEQLRAMYPNVKGRLYTELAPTQFDLLNFYGQNGFQVSDALEEHAFPLPMGRSQPPMGCVFASVPLGSVPEQHAFLYRLNRCRMSPITHDYLTVQMQQPFFLALGYYRNGNPIAEIMLTGASPDTAALVMLYVQKDMRRQGVGKSLLQAAADLLIAQGVRQAATQIYSANPAQMGFARSLGSARKRIVQVLPNADLG